MDLWRVEPPAAARRPAVMSGANLAFALGLHLLLFSLFWLYSFFHGLLDPKEEVVPIDLTVVVVENLDGDEKEPPPLKKPEPPPPPPPQPRPRQQAAKPKEPEKPKELERIETNVVVRTVKKEDPRKPREPEKPKKTREELLRERIERTRALATKPARTPSREPRPQPNGRTDRKLLTDAEIAKLLNQGYRPGASTNLASNEEQLGYSLVKEAFEAKWERPPWTDTLRPMVIRVTFGNGGRITGCRLAASSGDAKADRSILSAASRVGAIPALPARFIDKYRSTGLQVRFTVTPE